MLFILLLLLHVIFDLFKYASLCNLIKLVNTLRKYAVNKLKRFLKSINKMILLFKKKML